MNARATSVVLAGWFLLVGAETMAGESPARLFATDAPPGGWTQFRAAGFEKPACGVIYRMKNRVTNGMALGGVDTGCLDLEANGTFGYSTLFNSIAPRGGAPVRTPVLALSIGGKTWVTGGPISTPSLVHIASWLDFELGAQPAWANTASATPVPGWAKGIGKSKYDIPAGRVFCHTPAIVRWTSPIAGNIQISGGLWAVRNLEGRIQKWQLRKNGVPFTGGQIGWSKTVSSGAVQSLAAGSGGAAALQVAVQPQDRIDLSFEVGAVCGDHIGVDLKIVSGGAGKSWDLAADWSDARNPNGVWTYDDNPRRPLYLFEPGGASQVQFPKEIHYWGHYPVADLEYELDGPVQLGLRAWSPFLPGDLKHSTLPGIVFETRLRNTSGAAQSGSVVFNFPGPTMEEAGGDRFERKVSEVHIDSVQLGGGPRDSGRGVEVKAAAASYAIEIVGPGRLRLGGDLGCDVAAWTNFAKSLPAPRPNQAGTSAAVDFSLAAGEERVVRFFLAWCAPRWKGAGSPTAKEPNTFTHMYAKNYPSPEETLARLTLEHPFLLQRILAWQQVIYAETSLPVWLRDSLVNNLYMITETGLWAQAKPPLGSWVRPEDGLFGMIESPRDCPQVECIPCSLYGNIPVVYFFPELALSTLRGYKNYQFPDGSVVWMFGAPAEFAKPVRPYQVASSDISMVEMVDKMWLRTGDDRIVKEFYDAVKRTTVHSMNLRPDYGEKQVISMPTGDKDSEWVEFVPLYGLVSHVGGLHLAQLRMVKRMAEKMGDRQFAQQCDKWFQAGSKALEDDLWAGTHYLLYHEIKSGKKSDVLMGCLLDGEWIAQFHGLPGVFRPDRVKVTLDTIAKANADPKRCPYGMRVFAAADGNKAKGDFSYWGNAGTFSSEGFMLGMTYVYSGRRAFGEDIIRRTLDYVVRNGYTWDFPLVWEVDTGKRVYGSDYYQNMMLWSVPAVLAGQDLAGPCKPGGLVERILKAASGR